MDGNLEFRVLVYYLGAMYFFPAVYWRKVRRSPATVGIGGDRQRRARWVATGLFVVPLANYLLNGPWPWNPELGIPEMIRWAAAIPATLAILLLVWACRQTLGGPDYANQPADVETTRSDNDLEATGLEMAAVEMAAGESGGAESAAGELEDDPHVLSFVAEGPYDALRHPQLLAGSMFFLSLAVLSDNGFVIVATILGVLMLRLVVAPAVEADLDQQFGEKYETYRQRTGSFFFRLRRVPRAQYTVPRRFGLFPVLALTTVFAMLFGALNYMHASPPLYLFVSTEIAAICLVQIFFGSSARSASAVIGAVLLPCWVAIALGAERNRVDPAVLILIGLVLMLPGAVLGYFIGTLAAGFFLAMDLIEPYLPGYKATSPHGLVAESDREAP